MTQKNLPSLPVGMFNFERIRTTGKLYVDKTDMLTRLADDCERAFLSRPRRFGKSLMLSTLAAMFAGKVDLFKGLAAEEWVRKQAQHPNPVLRIDLSLLDLKSPETLEDSLRLEIDDMAAVAGVDLVGATPEDRFKQLIRRFGICGIV